ncbi:MAG: late competence development ComFB family protein [Burkholderiaceae bacterium]|nr:late competence development ComFB family protein [Burkholderiaceae bacterium]
MAINFEQVHNYYERLVFEDVVRLSEAHPDFTSDMLADVACVALNRLPARYVRHDVDMMFYLTEHERHAIETTMKEVLDFAFSFVAERAAKRGAAA